MRGWRRWLVYLPLLPPAALSILFTGRTAIVAPMAGAKPAELWEITDEAERAVPQVKLN